MFVLFSGSIVFDSSMRILTFADFYPFMTNNKFIFEGFGELIKTAAQVLKGTQWEMTQLYSANQKSLFFAFFTLQVKLVSKSVEAEMQS